LNKDLIMPKPKLIRITTVPLSLEKLLEGQLQFMSGFFEVTAISSEKERLEKFGVSEGVFTKHIEFTRKITPIKDLITVYKLYKYFRKEKPLIVHTHTPKAGIAGMLAAFLARVPIRLHTVAGLPLMETVGLKRWILNKVEKLTYQCATNVYPNSIGLLDFILSEKFCEPEKLKVLANGSSNGINTSYFNPSQYTNATKQSLLEELGIPENNFIFVFIGRLVADKGVNELVLSFEKLQKVKKDISLLLVGPYESDLDPLFPSTISSINSNSEIHSLGYQQDVRPYFSISQVLVFPSYREGFPNVVLQAGAMGLPSIVSNINGCNEIITDKLNGLLIPVKDDTAIYDAMLTVLENKDLYCEMKNKARAEIVTKYERKEVFEALLLEYRNLEAEL